MSKKYFDMGQNHSRWEMGWGDPWEPTLYTVDGSQARNSLDVDFADMEVRMLEHLLAHEANEMKADRDTLKQLNYAKAYGGTVTGRLVPVRRLAHLKRVAVGDWRVGVDARRECAILWHLHGTPLAHNWELCDTRERCMLCGIRCPEGAKMMAILRSVSFLGKRGRDEED